MDVLFTDSDLQTIRNLVYKWTSINISDRKKPMLSSRLTKRLREYNLHSMKEYIEVVLGSQHPDERQIFINLVTTNETYFFREYIHFEYLENILKKLYKPDKKLIIWSAASSSGEEAYSIAMTAAEILGINANWSVLATDINSEVLEKGRLGIFTMERIFDLPEHLLKKYCLKGVNQHKNHLKIIDELKSKVSFSQANLNELPANLGMFSVIFLRNVLIYFDANMKQSITDNIIKHLEPNGYLVVSLTETLSHLNTNLKPVGESYYFNDAATQPVDDDDNISFF